MALDPWYKIAVLRKEVREGRSFNPDEFAIHLEQIVSASPTAPEDYTNPEKFFSRTSFTRALNEHCGMVLRRLDGKTSNTAPVMTLVTQFGGGKTHTLAALYHLVTSGSAIGKIEGVANLLKQAGLSRAPRARVAAFVGNAWDPSDGRETPWLDIAYQLAGEHGVRELGKSAKTTPPGTEALGRVFAAVDGPVLLLFDEVLNFINRHRSFADSFHAFIQNLTVAMTGTTHGAAVISLPRSQVEMTDFDLVWQNKITKVVRRVAKDLIANDEAEIGEVVRKRLFDDLGNPRIRSRVAKTYADWCFDKRAELPPEWTAVDTTSSEAKAREYLKGRFEACYPFHPATLSVFQRKWQALPQYQQTRGTLAMLAQWISWAFKDGYTKARREPLITLGSAPLDVPEFRSVVLGQVGESRLVSAIDADIAGAHSHAIALDADTSGQLRDIHRRVGTSILFESSGGQVEKIAHLPELRFALGEPSLDTTSIDTAANTLEARSYYFRKVGTDGFKISHQPTMKKVVSDRRASLDDETEVLPAMHALIRKEFDKGASIPRLYFPEDSNSIPDTPRLTLVVADPDIEWSGNSTIEKSIRELTSNRGKTPRRYPASLVWAIRKPGRILKDKVEIWLAWKRVSSEINAGTLGGDFDPDDLKSISVKVSDAEHAARDEIWAEYRFVVLADSGNSSGLEVIDLGAGHSSSGESLCGRIITSLKSQALLNESVGAGYIERNWPPALKTAGAWPMESLRQCFLDGSLTRLVDPDSVLKAKIVEFVASGDFGLASGAKKTDGYSRIWFQESISPDEISFEKDVFLLIKQKVEELRKPEETVEGGAAEEGSTNTGDVGDPGTGSDSNETGDGRTGDGSEETALTHRIRISGHIPPEMWNRFGTRLIPKMKQGSDLSVGFDIGAEFDVAGAGTLIRELRQALEDLDLSEQVSVSED